MADITVDEAVRRNCDALITGNIAQIFTDMTPQAMAKLGQQAGAGMGGPMPKLTGYEIAAHEQEGEEHLYDVRFSGDVRFGVKARWREIDGAWKLVDFDGYQIDQPAGDAPGAAPSPDLTAADRTPPTGGGAV